MTFEIMYLKNVPIFEQLQLEEALLRSDNRNICLFNEGSSPAAVMGISGKASELVDGDKLRSLGIPLIQRFTGGGTVVVDENTLFISFICNKNLFPFPSYPERILKWSESIYRDSFPSDRFALLENDFVIEDLKCGGNAQYITKDRWIQHTSFLWDFCPSRMSCLLHPPKTPSYRRGRPHGEFIRTIREFFGSKEELFEKVAEALEKKFEIRKAGTVHPTQTGRISTKYIDLP